MKLIFDMDGTLYETARSIVAAVGRVYREMGLEPMSANEICSHIGEPSDQFMHSVLPKGCAFRETVDRVKRYEHDEVLTSGRLYPGVAEAVRALKEKGYDLILCSNGTTPYIKNVLTSKGIADCFSAIWTASEFASKGAAVKALLGDESGIMVGDSISDFRAAKENGLPCLAVTYGYGREEDYAMAAVRVDSASDIPAAIEKIVSSLN